MTKCFFNFRNCSFITNKTIQETCCTIIPDEIKTQEQYNLWYNKTQKEFLIERGSRLAGYLSVYLKSK